MGAWVTDRQDDTSHLYRIKNMVLFLETKQHHIPWGGPPLSQVFVHQLEAAGLQGRGDSPVEGRKASLSHHSGFLLSTEQAASL